MNLSKINQFFWAESGSKKVPFGGQVSCCKIRKLHTFIDFTRVKQIIIRNHYVGM